MIDPNRLARLFLDELQDTEQPIEQRGTILPLGIYEDGSAHLAVPGLINDGIEGWNALWDDAQAAREGAYPTFDEEQGKRSAGNSLMAAGLAATGGLAAGAAGGLPDNALASNAIRRGGVEPIRAYHGTTADIDTFRPFTVFADEPRVADIYAADPGGRTGRRSFEDGSRIIPVDIRFQNPRVLNGVDEIDSMFESLGVNQEAYYAKADGSWDKARATAAQDAGHDGIIYHGIDDIGGPQTQYVPLRPGTVFSATTGEQLFSNPRTAPLAPAIVNALEDNALASNAIRQGSDRAPAAVNALAEGQTSGVTGRLAGSVEPTDGLASRLAGDQPGHTPSLSQGLQEPGPRSSIENDQLPGSFGVTPEEIRLLRAAYDARNELPSGWYVHGRGGGDRLRSSTPIQATRDYDVMQQYGKGGSGWAIRPRADTSVLDLESIHTTDARRVGAAALRDMRSGIFPLERDYFDGKTPREISEDIRSQFSPDDIVNSAQAFDNYDWISWLYDRTGAGFAKTPNGAVALSKDDIDAVRLFSNPRTAPLAPMALSEDGSDDDFLSALLSRYGVNN